MHERAAAVGGAHGADEAFLLVNGDVWTDHDCPPAAREPQAPCAIW